jgi:hypothetical protein
MRNCRRFICLFLAVLAAAESLAAVSNAANRFFQAGLGLAASGEIEPAIGQFEAAIRLDPTSPTRGSTSAHSCNGKVNPKQRSSI